MPGKDHLLRTPVEHIDIRRIDAVPLLDMMRKMAFSARDLGRAAEIYAEMIRDRSCTVILCLAGSLFSAGQKTVVTDLIDKNMVDVIISTGANMIDQDFFEALGFRHYQGSPYAEDPVLQQNHVDRIYDTYIDEDELRVCDDTIRDFADALLGRQLSSREFLVELGRFLNRRKLNTPSVIHAAFRKDVPIFIPTLSDCSAGFGLMEHLYRNKDRSPVIHSIKDFLELTQIKAASANTGLVMIGGGVPKNFAQDCAVGTAFLGVEERAHKYAVQITVADARDGGLSGSTLREANSWGKVCVEKEQMVFCEATVAFPLLAAYAFHTKSWTGRAAKRWNRLFDIGKKRRVIAPVQSRT